MTRFVLVRCSFISALLLCASWVCQANAIAFPQGYIPFSYLDYHTNSLVVGEVTDPAGQALLLSYLNSLPAVSGDQLYSNEPVELAPGFFFNNVLVPTSAEIGGNFQDANSIIFDPLNHSPFVGNIIPSSRVGELFAFRLGSGDSGTITATPEPGNFRTLALGIAIVASRRLFRRSSSQERMGSGEASVPF